MSKNALQRLLKAGYSVKNLQEMFNALPKGIFVPDDEKNAIHLKRVNTVFMMRVDDKGYTIFWMVKSDEKDPEMIHQTTDKDIYEALTKMLLYTKSCNAF
jgi:hypothetical protein